MKKRLLAGIMILSITAMMAACGSSQEETTTAAATDATADTTASAAAGEASNSLTVPENWPEGTITYECGFSAGGTQDLVLRDLANFAAPITGNDYMVDNITGSSGLIMVNDVYSKDADGTTACIFSCLIPTVDDFQYFDDELLENLMSANLQISEQMSAVSQVNTDYPALYIPAEENRFTDFTSMAEYIEAHPGEISFGATGAAGNGGLMLQTFINKFNWNINDVYYDSTPEVQAAVLSGDIDVMCSTVAANTSDEWICIGYAAPEASDAYEGIPTFKECGYEFEATMRRGILVKQGTDQAIIDFMDDMFAQICEDPAYLESEAGYGYSVDYEDTAFFQGEIDKVVNGYHEYTGE